MPHKYYYLLIIPIISFVVVVGLGYWSLTNKAKPADQTQKTDQANAEQPYFFPDEQLTTDSNAQKRQILDEAVKRFRQAVTFKAVITQTQSGTKMTGNMEYVKPLRLHVTMQTDAKTKLETIIVGETAYVLDTDGKWKMTNDANIKDFGRKILQSLITSDDTLASFGVDPSAQIEITNNSSKKCTEYHTPYKTDTGNFSMTFCVNDKHDISFIDTQTVDGDILMEYSDFNSFFNIERPMLPLLEPSLNLTTSTNN